MELVDLLNRTRTIWDDELAGGVKSFIFNKTVLGESPKPRMFMAKVFVSLGYGGF